MPRVLPGLAAALALLGASPAPAQPGLEVDVLELDEAPEQAIQRLDEARRRVADERSGRREAPEVEPFIPEDSLGSRGLEGVLETTVPVSPGDLSDHLPGGMDLGAVLGGAGKDKDDGKGDATDGDEDDDKKKGGG